MAQKVLFFPLCYGVGHAGRMLLIANALRERLNGTIECAGNGPYGALFMEAGYAFHTPHLPDVGSLMGVDKFIHFYTQKRSASDRVRRYKQTIKCLPELIAAEIKLYESVKPDLIVWDGRWTAALAAEVVGIPFVSVMNTVLTPFARLKMEVPKTLPLFTATPRVRTLMTKLPTTLQYWLAEKLWSSLFHFSLRVVNKLRQSYGLKPYPNPAAFFYPGLRTVIIPEPALLSPIPSPPATFHYVGPIVWQPSVELPAPIWDLKDIIYITMGTTGNPMVFRPLIEAFASMPQHQVVMTVADLIEPEALQPWPANVHVYPFLPGIAVARRSKVMICQGALATMTQALSQGVPVLAIPLTIQHEMWSDMVQRLGVGLKLYAFEATPARVAAAVDQILSEDTYRRAAEAFAAQCDATEGPARAAELILKELEGEGIHPNPRHDVRARPQCW
jgi:MGT family glycosyltransferase